MTLLIACLILFNMEASWGWYPVALMIWCYHLTWQWMVANRVKA